MIRQSGILSKRHSALASSADGGNAALPEAERAPHRHITADLSNANPTRHLSQDMVTLYFSFLFSANIAASRFIKTEQAGPAPLEVDQINDVKLE